MNDKTDLQIFFNQPAALARFKAMVGSQFVANKYIQSVILAVENNPQLAQCSYDSIFHEALRAAVLGLSCDPVQREAQLVPRFNGKTKRMEAHLEPHYMGLMKLAIRTNKYFVLNVIPVMLTQDIVMDRAGLHWMVDLKSGMRIDHFPVTRVTAANIDQVRGYLGYFKTTRGFEKTVYMSVEEIMEHARTYSSAYQNDLKKKTQWSPWSKPDILPTMQMKTVLKELLKWADLSGGTEEVSKLQTALNEDDTVDADIVPDEYDLDAEFPPEVEPEPEPEPIEETPKKSQKKKTAAEKPEFDQTKNVYCTSAEAVNLAIEMGYFENKFDASNVMSKFEPKKAPLGVLMQKAQVYRGNRDSDLSIEESIKQANLILK